jgi:hypothetical protein
MVQRQMPTATATSQEGLFIYIHLLALKNDDDMYALIRGVLFISLAASSRGLTGLSFYFVVSNSLFYDVTRAV